MAYRSKQHCILTVLECSLRIHEEPPLKMTTVASQERRGELNRLRASPGRKRPRSVEMRRAGCMVLPSNGLYHTSEFPHRHSLRGNEGAARRRIWRRSRKGASPRLMYRVKRYRFAKQHRIMFEAENDIGRGDQSNFILRKLTFSSRSQFFRLLVGLGILE